jgi:hypothetical protein
MFERLSGPCAARSDEGFVVEAVCPSFTQFVVRYIEGSHVIELYPDLVVEGAATPIEVRYISRWMPPHDDEILDMEKRAKIADRIKAALDFLGEKCYIKAA